MFYGKPLYVAIAQRKEDRKARLEQRFAELATMAGTASPVILMCTLPIPVHTFLRVLQGKDSCIHPLGSAKNGGRMCTLRRIVSNKFIHHSYVIDLFYLNFIFKCKNLVKTCLIFA